MNDSPTQSTAQQVTAVKMLLASTHLADKIISCFIYSFTEPQRMEENPALDQLIFF